MSKKPNRTRVAKGRWDNIFFRIYNTKSEIVSKISKDLKKWFNEEKTGSTLNAYASAAGYRLDVNFVQ